MKNTVIALAGLLILLLQGCTNYMYTGRMTALDSQGEERLVVVYWPKTDPWLGKRKAGPVTLLTECGIPIRFDQQEEGIVFRGNPRDDVYVDGETPNISEFECGRFITDALLFEIDDGPASFIIQCEPFNGEFSAIKRTYIAARDAAYEIDMTSTQEKSLTGKTLDGPLPIPCATTLE
jgi:hypothetical protein